MSDDTTDRELSWAAGRPGPEPVCQFSYYAVDRALEAAEIPQWRREQLERMQRKSEKQKPRSAGPGAV